MKEKSQWIYGLATAVILLASTCVTVCGLRNKSAAGEGTSERTSLHGNKDLTASTTIPTKKRGDTREQLDNDALEKYSKSGNAAEKIAILNRNDLISDRKLLELIYKALEDPCDDVRFAAAQLLEKFDGNDAIPAISKALGDKNEEVRLVAVHALGEIDVPETAKLLAKGASDDSEDVRRAVFSIAFTKNTSTKEAILETAAVSQYLDVKEKLIDLAVDTPSHRTVETLLKALKDGDEELRNGIFMTFEVFFSEEFKTYDDARNWWGRNRNSFDEDLVAK